MEKTVEGILLRGDTRVWNGRSLGFGDSVHCRGAAVRHGHDDPNKVFLGSPLHLSVSETSFLRSCEPLADFSLEVWPILNYRLLGVSSVIGRLSTRTRLCLDPDAESRG